MTNISIFISGPPELWKCAICDNKILKPGNMALHYDKEHANFFKFPNIADAVEKSIKVGRRQNSKVSSSTGLKPVKKPKKNSVFWPCSICGNTFSIFQRYQTHLKTIHKITDQQVSVDMEALKKAAVLNEYGQTTER